MIEWPSRSYHCMHQRQEKLYKCNMLSRKMYAQYTPRETVSQKHICHILYYHLVFPHDKKNLYGYLYNLVKFESNQDIIKYPTQLFYLREHNSGLSLHRMKRLSKYSLIIEVGVQRTTRHNSSSIGTIPVHVYTRQQFDITFYQISEMVY